MCCVLCFSIQCVTDLDKLNLVKLGYGGLILGWRQFLLLLQLPQKMRLTSKVTKNTLALIHDTLCSKLQ